MAQPPQVPNLESQSAAMRRLNFLVGKWSGEGHIFRGSGEAVEMLQTEDAEYRLEGLILTIEGVGRDKSTGTVVLHALGIISFDDQTSTYQMRAFNDGRWLETELKLADVGQAISWGFTLGEAKSSSVLRMNDKGEWTEVHEITVGSSPPRKFMELTVGRPG